jgi:flagellar protein FliJ
MKIQPQFETRRAATLREATQIETLLRRLRESAETLDFEVATEEKRVGVSDPANQAYPILARVLTVRRKNLQTTIGTLETRLATLRQIFPDFGDTAA